VHAAVIDETGAPTKADQTVLIFGDRIAAVAPSGSTPIPRGTPTIDATGKFLIPGLWDAEVHTRYEGIDHLRLLIADGVSRA
jgi:imidazolonepropionase-like amidohydrolase